MDCHLFFFLLVDLFQRLNLKVLISIVTDHFDDLLFRQVSISALTLFEISEEPIHQSVVVLVEDTYFVLCILVVWHLQDALFVHHPFEDDCAVIVQLIGGFLSLMGAL